MCVVHLYEAAGLLLCNNCVLKFPKKNTNIYNEYHKAFEKILLNA